MFPAGAQVGPDLGGSKEVNILTFSSVPRAFVLSLAACSPNPFSLIPTRLPTTTKRPEPERLAASSRARELVETHPDTRDDLQKHGRVELFYDTEVYWCRKLAATSPR